MPNRSILHTLIGQEQRAARVYIYLLVTVIFGIDFFIVQIASGHGRGLLQLLPYMIVFLLLPFCLHQIKIGYPRSVKYIVFICYVTANLILEVYIYWGEDKFSGGNVAEIFFVLFSPIFINKRYFWTVVFVSAVRYGIIGMLFLDPYTFIPIGLLISLSCVSYITLNRFVTFVNALNESYLNRFEKVVKGIISTLELKDPYTRGHSQRVAEYAKSLASEIGIYRDDDLRLIYSACLLHDVGKVHTPDYILVKPDKLTNEEYELVKKHPIVGAEALKDIENMELCMDIVLYHHERWDGRGYPEGLRETQIPLTARIAAFADSFDAMTSHRSYRNAMTVEQAFNQIISGEGSQYDPALIPYFKKVFPQWVELHKKDNINVFSGQLAVD